MESTYVPCEKCGKLNKLNEISPEAQPVCGACREPLKNYHDGVVEVSDTALQNLLKGSPVPVITDFWAPWCGPCKMFAPVYSKTAVQYFGKAVFTKLNTDEFQLTAQDFKIRGIPTMVWFKGGVEVGRRSGAMDEASLKALLDSIIAA